MQDIKYCRFNRLGLSLSRESAVGLTDRFDMTIVVDWDVKRQIKQNKLLVSRICNELLLISCLIAIKTHLIIKYCEKDYGRSGTNLFGLKSTPVMYFINWRLGVSVLLVCQPTIFPRFILHYPITQSKKNVLIKLKENCKGNDLFTLHVMTD